MATQTSVNELTPQLATLGLEQGAAEETRAGHLACLRYAHESGCPFDEAERAEKVRAGHLACLRYAFEPGCPWNDYPTDMAEEVEEVEENETAEETKETEKTEKRTAVEASASRSDIMQYMPDATPWNYYPVEERTAEKSQALYFECQYMRDAGPWYGNVREATQHERRPQRVQRQAQARRKQHRARRQRKRLATHRQRQQAWPQRV
jgi:hypothetical protein